PIQSRTAVFRFLPLPESAIKDRLRYIADKEGVAITDEGLDAIVYVSEGDLRRAINTLQTVAVVGKEINKDLVFKMAGLARPEKVQKMIKAAYEGNFLEARDMLRELMLEDGISGEDLIRQIYREISASEEFSDSEKAKLISFIGEVDFRLALGLHPDVQLGFLLAQIVELGSMR
ncbi:MAG: replication factor C small subunit, partial [Thermoproteota archaeon]